MIFILVMNSSIPNQEWLLILYWTLTVMMSYLQAGKRESQLTEGFITRSKTTHIYGISLLTTDERPMVMHAVKREKCQIL